MNKLLKVHRKIIDLWYSGLWSLIRKFSVYQVFIPEVGFIERGDYIRIPQPISYSLDTRPLVKVKVRYIYTDTQTSWISKTGKQIYFFNLCAELPDGDKINTVLHESRIKKDTIETIKKIVKDK